MNQAAALCRGFSRRSRVRAADTAETSESLGEVFAQKEGLRMTVLKWSRSKRHGLRRLLVLIKSAATLLAQPSSIHHLHKQRAGAVFGIAKTVVQNAHDVETDIQANEIGKGQWTHGMCHSQFEYLVDGLWSRHTFHHRVHRLV